MTRHGEVLQAGGRFHKSFGSRPAGTGIESRRPTALRPHRSARESFPGAKALATAPRFFPSLKCVPRFARSLYALPPTVVPTRRAPPGPFQILPPPPHENRRANPARAPQLEFFLIHKQAAIAACRFRRAGETPAHRQPTLQRRAPPYSFRAPQSVERCD